MFTFFNQIFLKIDIFLKNLNNLIKIIMNFKSYRYYPCIIKPFDYESICNRIYSINDLNTKDKYIKIIKISKNIPNIEYIDYKIIQLKMFPRNVHLEKK